MAPSLVGLIGDPVAHSRSPAIQNAAFAHLGLAVRYELWHTPADTLPARVASLRAPGVLGANVTLPHKAAVIPLLDELEPEATQIGAVNTIYKRADGSLMGANTDAPGLLSDLREAGDFAPDGQRVLLLGASGAARAAAYALANAGVAHLVVANRTLERAAALVDDIAATTGGRAELVALALNDARLPALLAASTLVINATSVGWHGDESPLPGATFSPTMLVYDMVYRETRLLRDAGVCGARTLDGMGMLIYQGALAFSRWTGHDAPLEVMWAAVRDV